METIYLNQADYEKWDAFVDRSPQGSVFAKSWYLEALGVEHQIIIARDNDVIQGGIVLTKDKWGYYINPVFDKYLGILFGEFEGHPYTIESKCREVQRVLLEELKGLSSFEYTFHPGYTNWMPFYREGFSQTTRYTYRIDLAEAEGKQVLLDLMSPRLRNKITKAGRESGYHVENTDDIISILPMIEKTYERQGLKLPYDRDSLTALLKVAKAKEALQIFISKDEAGKTGAVLGLLYDKHTAYLMLNGVAEDNSERGINEALIHEGILWADKTGLKCFDFEGSMLPSIESFYRQFGGDLTPYSLIWKRSNKRKLRRLKQRFG